MPVACISAEQAQRNLRRSRASLWPDDRVSDGRLTGTAKVELYPSFQFSRADRVMTLGSCFAREMEDRLHQLGFDAPLKHVQVLEEEQTGKLHQDVANKFTVQSIENELRWASGEPPPPPERLFLETTDGLWQDPQLIQASGLLPLERTILRRELVQRSIREFADCRLVILTLGLAEAWFDEETGLYFNAAPVAAAVRRHPGRFRLDVLAYEDILDSLERIHALLKARGHPDVKVLLTVSPVPLKATFSGEDAITANTYSKAVQRAACSAFTQRHDDVDYFPSYEIVAMSDRELAFERDNLHVTHSLVRHITGEVLGAYAPEVDTGEVQPQRQPRTRGVEGPTKPVDVFALVKHQLAHEQFDPAQQACLDGLQRFGADLSARDRATLHYLCGTALRGLGRWEEAADQLQLSVESDPLDGVAAYKLGQAWLRLGRRDDAAAAFGRALAQDPSRPEFRQALARAQAPLEPEAGRPPRRKGLLGRLRARRRAEA